VLAGELRDQPEQLHSDLELTLAEFVDLVEELTRTQVREACWCRGHGAIQASSTDTFSRESPCVEANSQLSSVVLVRGRARRGLV
jgi:hypothetical protein